MAELPFSIPGASGETITFAVSGAVQAGVAQAFVDHILDLQRSNKLFIWLRVLGATETPQIDRCERRQFHTVVPLLFEFKAQQNRLELILPREGPLHA